MTRYLVSFDDGAMTFPKEDLPDVTEAAHEVVEQARTAGAWVFGGGVKGDEVSVVATDGSATHGPDRGEHLGGFAIIDVPSHREALEWAAHIAAACRCTQEVRELLPDPDV